MRGKVFRIKTIPKMFRITPAYAGKSTRAETCFISIKDHPRVCGEKNEADEMLKAGTGSPPRMRGKVLLLSDPRTIPWITPTYAGKRLIPICLTSIT